MRTVSVMKDSFGSKVLVPKLLSEGKLLDWFLVLPSCPEPESIDSLGLDHNTPEVPGHTPGFGEDGFFFLCVYPSLLNNKWAQRASNLHEGTLSCPASGPGREFR